jgi:hypothetical protein
MGKVEVSNQELRTIRDAMRELNRMVEDLEHGEPEKFVLTKNGQMRAVVVSVDYFATLRQALSPASEGLLAT